jgi:SpoVK/Ycf46/Vps4 family AAA+-type ATPase
VFKEFGVRFEGGLNKLTPSWQTVFFLSIGTQINKQFELLGYIHLDHRLYKEKLFVFPKDKQENPFLTPLLLNTDKLYEWVYPKQLRNLADQSFSAHEISSDLDWSDLFLGKETEKGLQQLKLWLKHGEALQKDSKLSKYINPGIRVLFYGPSGTGKTLTASLLGKEFNLPVYRVDLSQMVSKWVGETEKNLARIFDIAEQHNWILFFDEADALFSKRGAVNSSNDRRANQEISYLLQRVENYDGTIIMATNMKDNIDDAFIRRFQLMIHFPIPSKTIREQLWRHILEDTFPINRDVDLTQIAADFELTGGSMKNIFRILMLELYDKTRKKQIITESCLLNCIYNELAKSGVVSIKKRY